MRGRVQVLGCRTRVVGDLQVFVEKIRIRKLGVDEVHHLNERFFLFHLNDKKTISAVVCINNLRGNGQRQRSQRPLHLTGFTSRMVPGSKINSSSSSGEKSLMDTRDFAVMSNMVRGPLPPRNCGDWRVPILPVQELKDHHGPSSPGENCPLRSSLTPRLTLPGQRGRQ